MGERDSFIEDFKKLLGKLPDDDFDQWQFAYREVVVEFAAKIFTNFPERFTGPAPGAPVALDAKRVGGDPGAQPDVSGGPGIRPSTICQLGCLIDKS